MSVRIIKLVYITLYTTEHQVIKSIMNSNAPEIPRVKLGQHFSSLFPLSTVKKAHNGNK
jgi:hypothetical protein